MCLSRVVVGRIASYPPSSHPPSTHETTLTREASLPCGRGFPPSGPTPSHVELRSMALSSASFLGTGECRCWGTTFPSPPSYAATPCLRILAPQHSLLLVSSLRSSTRRSSCCYASILRHVVAAREGGSGNVVPACKLRLQLAYGQ